ncbi:hypothetical protein INT47_011056 [Mucor saturninus]|uniref:Flavin-containing monooxygenase n=1 Tax=Mucor saturninus TaxID=64648 RepID=A0A8H7RCZ8_9FUNG|nr:hypothetical protein INT47_011056 [Mucor saturninus]
MVLPTVAVIGSGFSGLNSAIQLKKKLGIAAEIFEATKDIGGTWNYNTYPGCASDIESHLYSFSFELNPNWSHKYSPQKEIYAYLHKVAKKYDVHKQVQFNTNVIRATWVQAIKKWELELSQPSVDEKNQIRHFDFIFSGIGTLRVPNIPEQFTSFEGKIIHSASWDHNYDLTNKRVAVIGSGTSAIQIVPSILDRVTHLSSFQRTPAWVAPRQQFAYSPFTQWCFTYIPLLMFFYRAYIFFSSDFSFSRWGNASSKKAIESRAAIQRYMEYIMTAYGREDLIPKMIPDFPVGCKRIGISDNYLAALCSPKTSVLRSPIKTVQGRTITTEDGVETEVDALILATGFNITGFLGELKVYGKDGVSLNQLWEEGVPKTYRTVSVHQFPNLFILLGPGSVLGHNSVVTISESQVDYGIRMIKYMMKNKIASLDPTEKAQETFSADIQSKFKGTVWKGGCQSWYMNKDGEIQSLWPESVLKFIAMLRRVDYESDFIKS